MVGLSRSVPLCLGLTLIVAGAAHADKVQPEDLRPDSSRLVIELNAAEDRAGACRLTFVAENQLGADLSVLGLEAVVFSAVGQVARLTLLDFQALPQGRKRVRQFDLPGLPCAGVGQVLINAASPCTGQGVDPAACMAGLRVSSRVQGLEIAG
ncbi:MAG: hypothetical protein Q7J57_13995 [Gemmobacter sp.]|nr:hypothetical protein [Gemmobacter sp.]